MDETEQVPPTPEVVPERSLLCNVIGKAMSGRFWLTIAAGYVFVYCSVKSILDPPTIAAIVTAITTSYFGRSDREKP